MKILIDMECFNMTQILLSFDKVSIKFLVSIRTAYCIIGRMSTYVGYPRNNFYGRFSDENEIYVQHISQE